MERLEITRIGFASGGAVAWGAAALFVALCWVMVWLGLRRSRSPRRRRCLAALRAVNVCLLALLLLGPTRERQRWLSQGGRVAVLLDTSASMGLGSADTSRLQQAAAWLQEAGSAFSESVDTWWFDGRCAPAEGPQPRAVSDGQATDILGALETAAEGSTEVPTSLLLVSDGADTESLRHLPVGEELPTVVKQRLRSLALPVDTVVVGEQDDFVDLAVEEVSAPAFAYVRNALEIEVRLRYVGKGEITVPLTLEQGNRTLDSRSLHLVPGMPASAKLKMVPDEIGRLALRVRVPVPEGDRLPNNNLQAFVTRIVRDKIRVLHVVGRPQWDVRFLREFLRTEPNIDLVSFYILRNLADAPGVSENELSLIPFPVHQLFGSELDTFDLVLLHNFNHAPYLVSFYLAPLADYVRRGGALCMIGGELSFAAGGYGGTPLEEVLPVRLRQDGDYEAGSFHPLPSDDARSHPVLQLGVAEPWGELPPLDSFNRAGGLQPGAEVLLVHPFPGIGGERAPLLALREVGRGRSAAMLSDSLWRWRFTAGDKPALHGVYHRLWQNLVHWLIRDPAMAPLVLEPEQMPLAAGRPWRLGVVRRGTLAQGRALLKIRRLSDGQVLKERWLEAQAAGRQLVELPPLAAGEYEAEVYEAESGRRIGREIILAGQVSAEQQAMRPRPDILRRVAEESGGRYVTLEQAREAGKELFRARPKRLMESSSTSPVLGTGWLLGMLILFWCVERWLRRRWGFA